MYMNDCIVSGDIFYANLNHGIGSEQSGYRPVLTTFVWEKA